MDLHMHKLQEVVISTHALGGDGTRGVAGDGAAGDGAECGHAPAGGRMSLAVSRSASNRTAISAEASLRPTVRASLEALGPNLAGHEDPALALLVDLHLWLHGRHRRYSPRSTPLACPTLPPMLP